MGPPDRYLTPPQLAKRWAVSRGKVLHWIASGQLRAANLAADMGGRPRWRIPVDAVLAFEQARAAVPAATGPKRRKAPAGVIEYF